ncbi:MAG: phosphoglycolate phosphatase [Pseudomonadota bacterium]
MIPVLFDLDGTLIDSLPNIGEAANVILQARNLPALPPSVVATFVGLGEEVFVDRLIAATDLPTTDRDTIMQQFISEYKRVAQDTRCFPGVSRALGALKARGAKMGIVTNKPRAPMQPTLEAAELTSFFDVVVAGDDLPTRKPDAAPLRHAMAELGAVNCVYIGDTPIDAETARASAVPFGLFTEGIRTVPIKDIHHDFAFDHFDNLIGTLEQNGAL